MPLGGGWGIAVPAVAAIGAAHALGWLGWSRAIGLGGGAVAVALVGWIDDRVTLSARVRLLVQVSAASWLVGWLGGVESLDIGTRILALGSVGNALAVLAVVWCTNLYNFMDGIDGLAGTEALCVAAAGGALLLASGATGPGLVALVVAAAAAGFLVWNRPPARIFMGDAGSGLLGFTLAGLAFTGESAGAGPALAWLILLGVFVTDATVVLIRRIARGERWYSAHRGHMYQRLTQAGWSHGRVDRAVLVLNLVLIALAVPAWWRGDLLLPMLGAAVLLLAGALVAAERYVRTRPASEPAAAPPPG